MNPEFKTPLLILILISFFSFSSLGENKTSSDEWKKLTGTWFFQPVQAGKIPVRSKAISKNLQIEIKADHSYSYFNKGKNLKINGNWEFNSSERKIILQRDGNFLPQEFIITKLNEEELVIKTDKTGYVLRSAVVKTASIGDYRGVLGIFVLIFLAFLVSNNKRKIDWRIPAVGLVLQIVFAVLILKVGIIRVGFGYISSFFVSLLGFTLEGAGFVFGDLVNNTESFGIIFAFRILPTVIFFSAFTSLLYYFGILQKIVWIFAWIMSKAMRLSGSESLSAAANVFIGQTEAPLVIKPYLAKMTSSEILALMTGGMATIAGGVMAAYISFLGGNDPEQQKLFATHLLTASIMNAPAALYLSKIIFPQVEPVNRDLSVSKDVIGSNVLDALAKGTTDGLKLAVNVGAMLLVFTAMMALLNYIVFHWIGSPTGLNDMIVESSDGKYSGLNMQYLLGMAFAPLAWLMGVPHTDLLMIGQLLGEKTILNEFFAYTSMAGLKDTLQLTNPKSIIIATYALCGFANFASIGIQIGGISSLAPNQRENLSKLGIRALIGGTIASMISASIAGMLL